MAERQRNYWLHRITGGENALPVAKPLLEKENYLSIGWCWISSDEFVRDVQERGIDAVNDKYKEIEWNLSRNRWNLWRFIHEMKKGDYVIVPSSRKFSVYEIVDDDIFSNQSHDILFSGWEDEVPTYDGEYILNKQGDIIDLGFYRKVKPVVTDVPRETYAKDSLILRMKIRQTNACINDIWEQVEETIVAFRTNKPINLKEEILKVVEKNAFKKVNEVISSNKFENLIEWYLKSIGASRVETPAKNSSPTEEGDADKVAYFEKLKLIIMVQAKKHDGTTDKYAVQQIIDYNENNSYEGYTTAMWVISSAKKFSKAATKLAEASGVHLINGLEFTQLILENGLNGLSI